MSTVIRAGEASTLRSRITAIDLNDHFDDARRVVERARREAERLISAAHAQVDRVHRETRESGYQAGYQDGQREGKEAGFAEAHAEATADFERDQANVIADLHRVVDEIDAIKTDLRLAANKDLLRFAVGVAEKLTFAIGKTHTESASANLQRAVELIGSGVDLMVRAHPHDVAALRMFASGVTDHVSKSNAIRFVEDDEIAPGGCVVTSDTTEIDATLETQTGEIAAMLLGS